MCHVCDQLCILVFQGFADKYSPTELEASRRLEAQHQQEQRNKKGPVGGLQTFLKQINNDAQKRTSASVGNGDGGGTSGVGGDVTNGGDGSSASPGWAMKSPLMHVRGFLESLLTDNKDGRIVVKIPPSSKSAASSFPAAGAPASLASHQATSDSAEASLRFLLLNPSNVFADVVRDVRRSVAGLEGC